MPSAPVPLSPWPLGEGIYRQFLDGFVDEMYLHDDQGVLLDVNPAACQSLGYTREELIGMRASDLSARHSEAQLLALWQNHPLGENRVESNRLRRKNGSVYHVDVHIACQAVDGRKCFLALARNTEEKHRREQEILELNAQLKHAVHERTRKWHETSRLLEAFMEQTPDGVFIKDDAGRYQYVNPAVARRIGRPLSELLGRTDEELFTPEIAEHYRTSDLEALSRNEPFLFEERLPVNGEVLYYNVMKTPYRDADGKVVGLLGMMRDNTSTRRTREQLEQNYEMLRQAERIAKTGSWTLDLATGQFTNSEMLAEMNGNRPGDPPLTPQSLASVLEPQDHVLLSQAIQECVTHGTSYSLDMPHKRPEGGTFPCRIRGQAYRDSTGRISLLYGTVQDLTEHVEAQERLETLADNLPHGAIFRCTQLRNQRLRLDYVSRGVEHLLGLSAQALVSSRGAFFNTVHPDDRASYQAHIANCLSTGTPFDAVCRLRHTDGQTLWVRTRAIPRLNRNALLWEGMLLDVTTEHESQQALQRAKEAAESAERAKSEFLATMSHEIRTPMNTVIGMTQLLQQSTLSPKQRNYLDKVALSASALLAIINDILDFSKLEADMLHLAPESFSVEHLLDTLSAVTSLRAEQKGIEIVYAVHPNVPRQLYGDAQRLTQVLTNLVGNAIKFTDRGEVVVHVHAQPDERPKAKSGDVVLQVSVHDTGIGIHPDQKGLLFRPFSQAEAHISRRFGGTGLGLAISRQLIQLMGGDITVDSQPGRGSDFRFHVRMRADTAEPHAFPTTYQMQDCRVLVVDDNLSARSILREMVNGFGLECSAVASGAEALEYLQEAAAQKRPFQVVLMDWRMPGMDGLEVAEHIRSNHQLSDTPAILMVTAYCRDEVLERVGTLGLQGLLIKPVTESALFNAMHEALHLKGDSAPQARSPGSLSRTLSVPLALAGKRVLVVDDNALNREVAQDFLELASMQVRTASNGRDALAMLQTQAFDLVLLDVQMPEMDGLEVARRIRHQRQWSELPVLALTAQAQREDHHAILASGMNGHLTKPLDGQTLYLALCHALRLSTAPASPAHTGDEATANTPPQEAPHPHAQFLFAGDSARTRRLLQSFLRDFGATPAQMEALHKGHEWSALNLVAHTLKGSLGYLEQPHAVAAMSRLEDICRETNPLAADVAPALQQAQAELLRVLAQIKNQLGDQDAEPPQMARPAINTQQLQATLLEALPRVERGDYDGVRLLEQVEVQLRGHELHGLASRALSLAEDLEKEAACEALQKLLSELLSV
jgi:two-component system sensor histidine kinase/response regulator